MTPTTTLRDRIGRNHLRGRIRASTFRLTLAAALRGALPLRSIGPKRLDTSSEEMVSAWIRAHLDLAVHPFEYRDPLENLEDRVLLELDPPLNLDGMKVTSLRATLSLLRASLAEDTSVAIEAEPARPAVAIRPRTPAKHSPMQVNTLIQEELRRRGLEEVPAVEAARWLDSAALLADSDQRPGLPLRNLLRAGLIQGAEQRPPRPNGRWFITQIAE